MQRNIMRVNTKTNKNKALRLLHCLHHTTTNCIVHFISIGRLVFLFAFLILYQRLFDNILSCFFFIFLISFIYFYLFSVDLLKVTFFTVFRSGFSIVITKSGRLCRWINGGLNTYLDLRLHSLGFDVVFWF